MPSNIQSDGMIHQESFPAPASLTATNIKPLFNELKKILSSKCDVIHLNLSAIEEIDTAGIQTLMAIKKQSIALGKKIVIEYHSLPVLKILELYGLSSFFGDTLRIPKSHADQLTFPYGRRKAILPYSKYS